MTEQPSSAQAIGSNWSPQQEDALAYVKAWLRDKNGPQVLRLFGYAGTGKTTLAKEFAEMVKGTVLFATFTGKAALVLQSKGCHDASTLHSLIYTPSRDEVTGEFKYKINKDSPLATAGLLIVDEVSMVGAEMARDILSFGTKVLVLGDPAQLPPVKDTGFFINARPDIMLTEVHRQAKDNPIVWLSMQIREGRRIDPGRYDDTILIDRNRCDKQEAWQMVSNADQLLVGMNRTRTHSNTKIRRGAGLVEAGDPMEWLPVKGDRMICLKNDRENGLLNGMLFDCLDAFAGEHEGLMSACMRVKSLDQPKRAPIDVNTPKEYFFGTESELDWRAVLKHQQFTYGWAITCHKAQGSQWNHVGVIDESGAFRTEARKWLYTAVTRAAERLTMVI